MFCDYQHVAARMSRWERGRMNGFSEDLRRGIVSAVERGMSNSQAARTFDVSLSSVKRYVNKADHEESLAPKKSPGSAAKLDEKATKLLEVNLDQRLFATLQERRDYIHALTGLLVSRSTICRAVARIGQSRKKGTVCHRARRVPKSPLESNRSRRAESRVAGLC
jgi:transposase